MCSTRWLDKFKFVPDVCVIFIPAFDMFRSGLPLYHVKKIVMETGQIVEDGLTEIYANALIDNGSKFSKLMKVFTENDTYNTDEFPVTSKIKARFKLDEGGAVKMDETLQKWKEEGLVKVRFAVRNVAKNMAYKKVRNLVQKMKKSKLPVI